MQRLTVALGLFLSLGTPAFGVPQSRTLQINELRNGDLIFQSRDCGQLCVQIEAALQTPYSHLGIVYIDPTGVRIIDSADRVRLSPIADWLNASRSKTVDVMRLKRAQQSGGYGEAVVRAALKQLGKPYDAEWDWDDANLYCSELVWKSFQTALRLELSTPKDYHSELSSSPNRLFWQGYFRGEIPHRLGVSPKDLAASRYLEKLGSLPSR